MKVGNLEINIVCGGKTVPCYQFGVCHFAALSDGALYHMVFRSPAEGRIVVMVGGRKVYHCRVGTCATQTHELMFKKDAPATGDILQIVWSPDDGDSVSQTIRLSCIDTACQRVYAMPDISRCSIAAAEKYPLAQKQ